MQVRKEMIVVGDRILLQLDETQDKTKSGLYLPPSVREKEKVAMGKVVKVGPGYPIPNLVPAQRPDAVHPASGPRR
jgi:co-chaperonin GroES (HSP10)